MPEPQHQSHPQPRRIDLHTHSNVSDGTETPADLVASAVAAGLDVVGLTDHDTTEGWAEARRAAEVQGIQLVPGIELTARQGWTSVHVLGYGFDPQAASLLELNATAQRERLERARTMVERLAADYPISWESVAHEAHGVIGRPHIADALVNAGVVPDRSAAFQDILRPDSQYYVAHAAPTPLTVVMAIAEAGGATVLAHPAGRTRPLDEPVLAELVNAGLAGLEVWHRDNTAAGREWLLGLVNRWNLVATGSSDYHGMGKPNRLGENLTSESMFERLARRAGFPAFP